MALFTVGIPTHNRAHYLPETLSCLLRQTYQDFEVIISDNASTDSTTKVVGQFQDSRIRYVRQESNVGPIANFLRCAELARTEWIVFNQDDDLLCPLFLERFASTIEKHPNIVMYATDILHSADVTRLHGATFGGFPLKHRWDQPQPRLIPGEQVAALNWFMTGFMPPAQAFLTRLFLKHWPRGEDALLQGDHYLTSHVACEGVVAYESYVGAILRHHSQRICVQMQDSHRKARHIQFNDLRELFAEKQIDWQSALRAILPELPLEFRQGLLGQDLYERLLPADVVEILADSIATERGMSSEALLAGLKAERIANTSGGRLERMGLPRPIIRLMRGALSAMGKRY